MSDVRVPDQVQPQPPPHDGPAPVVPLYSISFADRLEKIRQEIRTDPIIAPPPPAREGWWARSKRFLPIVIVLAWVAISTFMFYMPQAGQSVFVLSDIRVTGPTNLCPGETLDFEFDVTVKEVGTYNLWMSTWKTDPPPAVVIFSETQPFVVGSTRFFPIARKWLIPTSYNDPGDSVDKPLIPGTYFRDISVTAEGKNTNNDPKQVEFRIRSDCPVFTSWSLPSDYVRARSPE